MYLNDCGVESESFQVKKLVRVKKRKGNAAGEGRVHEENIYSRYS